MRRVDDEALLPVIAFVEPPERAVHGLDQRHHLRRQPLGRQPGAAPVDVYPPRLPGGDGGAAGTRAG